MKDPLSVIFSALADPTRRAILARLAQGEASVSDLAEPFLGSMSLPAITKHLKVLESAGLVTKSREAQWRATERLTYTQMFSDENKGPGRHPMLPVFPDKMHTTVLFALEANGQTRVSAAELAEFVKARAGMTGGWTGSFDKLEDHLATLRASL